MDGCGGKFLTFIAGMLIGIILFVGAIGGGLYFVFAYATVGQINAYTIKNEAIESNEDLSNSTLLDVGTAIGQFFAGQMTFGELEALIGVDVVGIVLGSVTDLEDSAYYVLASDVASYSGGDYITAYSFDSASNSFVESCQLKVGYIIDIVDEDGENVAQNISTGTAVNCTTAYGISEGAVVEVEGGNYIKVIGSISETLANCKLNVGQED
jgi:hypothetical protein